MSREKSQAMIEKKRKTPREEFKSVSEAKASWFWGIAAAATQAAKRKSLKSFIKKRESNSKWTFWFGHIYYLNGAEKCSLQRQISLLEIEYFTAALGVVVENGVNSAFNYGSLSRNRLIRCVELIIGRLYIGNFVASERHSFQFDIIIL